MHDQRSTQNDTLSRAVLFGVMSYELERHILVRSGVLRLTAFGDDEVHAACRNFQLPLRRTILRHPRAHAKIFAGNCDQVAFAEVPGTGFRLLAPDRDPHPGGGLAFAVPLVNRQVEVGHRLAGLRLTQLRIPPNRPRR